MQSCGPLAVEKPGFRRASSCEGGLCRHFLVEGFIKLFLVGNALSAVELEDGSDPDRIGLHTLVFRVLNLAFDLDVGALLELGCELGQLAEDDEVMPLGALVVLAGLFVLVESLVARESVVNCLSFLPVRTTASPPRKPMRITLFRYMIVSPF